MAKHSDILIGIDAGTSVIKAVAFSLEGEQLAVASTPNRIKHVAQGGVEQDMAWTWRATAQTLRELGGKLTDLPARTAAISVTAQGDGTWLIDADNQPVTPAWLWLDGRPGGIVADLRRSDLGEQLFRITGTGLNTSHQSGHLKWLKKHRPEILTRAAKALHCKDWLYLNFCGEIGTDPAEGVLTFGDYRTRAYADEVLEILDLQEYKHLLPPLIDGTQHHGRLTRDAAAATGFREGTPVVLAPVDYLCTGIGAGVYHKTLDLGCTIVGSTGIHLVVYHSLEEIEPKNQVGFTMPFCVPGTWAGLMSNMAAALNLNWFLKCAEQLLLACDASCLSRSELLTLLDRKAGEAPPGTVIYHPFIFEAGERGPFVEPLARAQFLGLTTKTSLFDLIRAVYEGLGFAARDCYGGLSQHPPEVRLTGGMARSALFRRILASAIGVPVRVSQREETGAAGAAVVAAACLGHYDGVAAACPAWVDAYLDDTPQQPDPELTPLYDRMYEVYRLGYRQSFDFWHALDEVRREA
jgi:erythritol kinase (D-erythritol 1-phosphate-forming)